MNDRTEIIQQQIERGMAILRSLNDLEEDDGSRSLVYHVKLFENQKFYDENEIGRLETKVTNWQNETKTCLILMGIPIDDQNPLNIRLRGFLDNRGGLAGEMQLGLRYLNDLKEKPIGNEQTDMEYELLSRQIEGLKDEVNKLARENAALKKQLEGKGSGNTMDSGFMIVENRKIDVIKILHAMCQIGLFQNINGSKIAIKSVMSKFGCLLNDDFSKYSINLSTSKTKTKEVTYMQVFDDLRIAAKDYLKKS